MSNAFDLYDTSLCPDTEKSAAPKPLAPRIAWRVIDIPHPVCSCGLDIDFEKIVTSVAELALLSPKETQILLYLFKGLATKEMAEALGNTDKTLKHHIARVFWKLGVNSRSELVATLFNLNDARRHVPSCSCGIPIDFKGYVVFAALGVDLTY